MKYPPIGTTMYSVHEHRYYIPGYAAPLLEYCVCSGTVQNSHFQDRHPGIKPPGIKLLEEAPGKGRVPSYYRLSEIGKRVFFTREEAEALAEQMTDAHEWKWSGWGAPEFPMRRPWRERSEK